MTHTLQTLKQAVTLLVLSKDLFQRGERIYSELQPLFGNLNCVKPTSIYELEQIVKEGVARYDTIVVAGGDGTINRVINSMDIENQRLIVLPGGRGNDLARALKLPLRISECIASLGRRNFIKIDLGQIGDNLFHNSAGLGLDVQVLDRMRFMPAWLRKNYLLAFITTLPLIKPIHFSSPKLPKSSRGFCWWLAVMNGPMIGSGLPISPNAKINDGKLDVIAISNCFKLIMLFHLPKMIWGKHLNLKEVEYMTLEELRIEGLNRPVNLAIDGEIYEWNDLSLNIKIRKQALTVLG